MKVTVIVPGRLHGFELAKFLQGEGMLNQLITGYPTFEVKKWGIQTRFVTSVYVNEVINRGTHLLFKDYRFAFQACEAFDRMASLVVNASSDIYIIWSSYASHTIKKLRKINPNAVIILDRGSAHIETQNYLLNLIDKDIYINKNIVEKEVEEYRLVDYITVPSLFARQTFLDKNISSEKLFVNNLGVNLVDFIWIERERAADDPLVLGYVGVMSAQKNVTGLVKVVDDLVAEGLNIQLHLVGKIDHKTFDKKVISGKRHVVYKGSFPQSELINCYKEMDVFVLNSIQDGFGMVILQAMSTGLPVIATENTGGPDVITEGHNGFVIRVNDNDALSDKIRRLYLDRQQCLRMGKNARLATETGFSWTDYGNRYLELMDWVSHAPVSE